MRRPATLTPWLLLALHPAAALNALARPTCCTVGARRCSPPRADADGKRPSVGDSLLLPNELDGESPWGQLPGAAWLYENFSQSNFIEVGRFSLVLIALFAVSTLPSMEDMPYLYDVIDIKRAIDISEELIAVVFLGEFLVRWYATSLRPGFLVSPLSIIDMLSFAPLILSAMLGSDSPVTDVGGIASLRLLRVLRLQRFLVDANAFREFRTSLGLPPQTQVQGYQLNVARVLTSVLTIVFITAGLMYQTEHFVNPLLPDYFTALYFSLTTLTTVGFGDITPVTVEGRITVCLAILTGVAVIPLQLAELGESLLNPNGAPREGASERAYADSGRRLADSERAYADSGRRLADCPPEPTASHGSYESAYESAAEGWEHEAAVRQPLATRTGTVGTGSGTGTGTRTGTGTGTDLGTGLARNGPDAGAGEATRDAADTLVSASSDPRARRQAMRTEATRDATPTLVAPPGDPRAGRLQAMRKGESFAEYLARRQQQGGGGLGSAVGASASDGTAGGAGSDGEAMGPSRAAPPPLGRADSGSAETMLVACGNCGKAQHLRGSTFCGRCGSALRLP